MRGSGEISYGRTSYGLMIRCHAMSNLHESYPALEVQWCGSPAQDPPPLDLTLHQVRQHRHLEQPLRDDRERNRAAHQWQRIIEAMVEWHSSYRKARDPYIPGRAYNCRRTGCTGSQSIRPSGGTLGAINVEGLLHLAFISSPMDPAAARWSGAIKALIRQHRGSTA